GELSGASTDRPETRQPREKVSDTFFFAPVPSRQAAEGVERTERDDRDRREGRGREGRAAGAREGERARPRAAARAARCVARRRSRRWREGGGAHRDRSHLLRGARSQAA